MSYANVSGGANSHYPVGGNCGGVGGAFSNAGSILVLFILLVIIARALCW